MFIEYILNPLIKVVRKHGSNHAFCINEHFYTYTDLAQSISKIRKALKKHHINTPLIGLVVNDDIETYASIFALWLEGYAYVPLHPKHPIERSLEIISQANLTLIIDSSPITNFNDLLVIESSSLTFDELNLLPESLSDEALAYILFTSGSTGKPKGVPITRNNLGSFMKAFWETGIQVNENDRCLQAFDLTFDVSVQSFLVPLTKGACTYTIPHDQIKYSYASELLEDQKLTFSVMAPSMVRFLKPYFDEIYLPDLRYSILTAEASSVKLVEEWSACIPKAEIYDFYGPTEATIYCTYSRFYQNNSNKQINGILSIGKPLNGITAILIDEKGKILPPNHKGELCIAGKQVTPGYWNNPIKNKESFFETRLDGTLKRFYKTGDLCYIDSDGDILYSGRLDHQVKIQGYRIELSEIEHFARLSLNGKNAVAIVFENSTENNEIALFIEDELNDSTRLLKALQQKLPQYMIPSKIFFLKELPLNTNGKVDRNALKKRITV